MGVFNIIETFFFLSLAITFILILLLVNHFKHRINTLEQKCDTMFEVINSILQDVGSLSKVFSFSDPRIQAMHPVFTKPQSFYDNFAANSDASDRSKSNPEVVVELNDDDDDKIVVSDDDDEDYSDDDTDDECDEDEDDEEDEEDEIDQKIKIVNMDILDNKIDIEIFPENRDNTSDEVVDDITDGNDEDLEEIITEIPEIQVLKMNGDIDPMTDDTIQYEDSVTMNQKDVYNKMTVQELKKVVITLGLCSDASKLKKPDLLKLLEQ
jgi:hypothetical protein